VVGAELEVRGVRGGTAAVEAVAAVAAARRPSSSGWRDSALDSLARERRDIILLFCEDRRVVASVNRCFHCVKNSEGYVHNNHSIHLVASRFAVCNRIENNDDVMRFHLEEMQFAMGL